MDCDYINLYSTAQVNRTEFGKLQENLFWSKGGEQELRIHRIHAYPAKFPAFITTKALAFAKSRRMKVERIGDVFCGCGTVAFEARRNGIDFWGCDINPVATLIASVKSSAYDPQKLQDYHEKIIAKFSRATTRVRLSDTPIPRLDYSYP